MEYITPEKAGISSRKIKKYIEMLEEHGLSNHSLILAKGNDIFFEKYWAPFDENFLHRQYSVSKSIVSIAVGFCEQDGLLSLDDKMIKHFPLELENQSDERMKNQTVRDMLMMSTSKSSQNWFTSKHPDRVKFYFENNGKEMKMPGSIFEYDSTGSFVLSALVERLTGKPFMEYLREKFFDKIGVSKEAYCLKCPGGNSWGDSAVLCTSRDLLKIARFVMNGGAWDGEQILNREYIEAATSKQIDNNLRGVNEFDTQGYGYLIWRTKYNGFFFNGMGCQFAVCMPDKDIIMIYNGDNQGDAVAKRIIFENFFDLVYNKICDKAILDNEKDYNELIAYSKSLKLAVAKGEKHSENEKKVNGKKFKIEENAMGIKWLRLSFEGEKGQFEYENEQGEKMLEFKLGENHFGLFPQEGYSDDVGAVATKGYFYKCAASAAWVEPHKLYINAQIIDKYFGRLHIFLSFLDDSVSVCMEKTAEDFLNEYTGFAYGKAE